MNRASNILGWGFLRLVLLCNLSGCLEPEMPPADKRLEVIESMASGVSKQFPKVPQIRAQELILALEGKVLVDVREVKERAISSLPGAIAAAEIEKNPSLWKGRQLVAFCTVGLRSSQWALKWNEQGLEVSNLWGGVLAWAWAGGKFYQTQNESKRVHVFAKAWNLLPPQLEAVTE